MILTKGRGISNGARGSNTVGRGGSITVGRGDSTIDKSRNLIDATTYQDHNQNNFHFEREQNQQTEQYMASKQRLYQFQNSLFF